MVICMGAKFANLQVRSNDVEQVKAVCPQAVVKKATDGWITVVGKNIVWGTAQKEAKRISKALPYSILATEYFDDDYAEFTIYKDGKKDGYHVPYLKDRKYFHIKVLKSGSLRFWGDWFGRPMDNIHTVVSTEYLAKENKLILHFSEGETCTIYEPAGIVNEVEGFHIKDAAKVEWEWYAYGKEPSGKTLCRRIYTRKDNNAVLIESYGEPEQGVKVLHFHDLYALEIY